MGLLGVAVYLFIFTESANGFNIGFMVLSIILGAVSLLAFKFRKNLDLMTAYLVVLGIIFLAQLILTILILANKNKIIDWAIAISPSSEESF